MHLFGPAKTLADAVHEDGHMPFFERKRQLVITKTLAALCLAIGPYVWSQTTTDDDLLRTQRTQTVEQLTDSKTSLESKVVILDQIRRELESPLRKSVLRRNSEAQALSVTPTAPPPRLAGSPAFSVARELELELDDFRRDVSYQIHLINERSFRPEERVAAVFSFLTAAKGAFEDAALVQQEIAQEKLRWRSIDQKDVAVVRRREVADLIAMPSPEAVTVLSRKADDPEIKSAARQAILRKAAAAPISNP